MDHDCSSWIEFAFQFYKIATLTINEDWLYVYCSSGNAQKFM